MLRSARREPGQGIEQENPGRAMIFVRREDAGRQLALPLTAYANRRDAIVSGVPRGGVPVAFAVARALNLPLDIFVLRNLGMPGREELAFGAIANGGVRVLEEQIIEAAGLSDWQIERVTRAERTELTRRQRLYQDGRPALEVRGKTVILVDDGMATGSSLRAGVLALRQMQPAAIVIAAPVAPAATGNRLRLEVDDIVCVEVPETFYGVGPFYLDFSQVSDEEVIELLDRASGPRFDHPHGHREATPGASA